MPPLVVAHRGASAVWPEHTRAAYLQALADGADGLECDVRLTADGVAVCWHDANVDRTSDGSGLVHEHTVAQLRTLDVLRGAAPPPGFGARGEQVLTLDELVGIAVAARRALVLAIELKHPTSYGWAAEDEVLAVLERWGWEHGRLGPDALVEVSLMSFHPGSLAYLASRGVAAELLMQLLEQVDPAQAAADGLDERTVRALEAQAFAAIEAGAVGGVGPGLDVVRAHPDRVLGWQVEGLRTRVWTVDDADDVLLCRALGVAEVTTNDPAGVRRLLG